MAFVSSAQIYQAGVSSVRTTTLQKASSSGEAFSSTLQNALQSESNSASGRLLNSSSLVSTGGSDSALGSYLIRVDDIGSVDSSELQYYGYDSSSGSGSIFNEGSDSEASWWQGGDANAEVTALPDVKSYYTGEKFTLDGVSVGIQEVVGDNIQDFHNAHFVEKDGLVYAYFIDHSDDSLNDVGLAISEDGVNFEYQGKVLTKGDSYDANKASFPSVEYDEDSGQWIMLYEATSAEGDIDTICMATSDDGVSWTKHGPIIEPGDAGWISGVDVGTPTMFKENGVWNVYFHTFAEDGRVRIGYASGTDLETLDVMQGALLDVDAEGDESVTVGSRSRVFQRDGYYYMAYEISSGDNYDFNTHTWGINLARSTSPGGPWEKMDGPLLLSDDTGFGTDGPEILEQDGQLYVYYRNEKNGTTRAEITGL